MPENEVSSHHADYGKTVQSLNPPQRSTWLTHWAGARYESSTHDQLTQINIGKGDDHDLKKHQSGVGIASDNFGSSKGVRDVDLAMNLKKPGSQSFPFFKLGQESGRSSISNKKGEIKGVLALEPKVSPKKLTTALNVETLSRGGHFQPEAVSEIPSEKVKYHMFFGESSDSFSRPSKEKFTRSASHLCMDQGPYKLPSRKTHGSENFRQLTAAFAAREPLPNTNLAAIKQQHPTHCSHSTALVSNENGNGFSKPKKSEMPSFFRQKNAGILEADPSTSGSHSPANMEDQFSGLQRHIGMGFLSHQTGYPDMAQAVHHGSCSFQNFPHFIHDVEGLAGGLHSFSRTTNSLLITRQTDVEVYQDNQIFRESKVSTHLKGEAMGELNCSRPHFPHGQQGVKLQLLDSPDRKSQENVADVKADGDVQMNESSPGTDAMGMNLLKENHLSGAFLSLQNKDNMVESNLPLGDSNAMSAEKTKRGKRKIELPDMNLEFSALPAASSSAEKAEPSPSRTRSLDINTSQFKINHASNSKSDECSDSNMGSGIGSRWIKRLKLNDTKTSKPPEASFHGKLNKFFTRAANDNPEPALDTCHGKKLKSIMGKWHHEGSELQIGEEQRPSMVSLFGKGESSSSQTKQEIKETMLSNTWIRRWSHNQGDNNPKHIETSKPENSEPPAQAEEFQKKQFPSIAAMALMGKAMNGYHQCKFQKKEAFVTWNTKTFD